MPLVQMAEIRGILAALACSLTFAGGAKAQVTVPGGNGNVTIVFGLATDGPQDGGPIQVNLEGARNELTRLVIIGPRCEVAMGYGPRAGRIAISSIKRQMTLSRGAGPDKGMSAVSSYAKQVGFQLSAQEIACGRRVFEQTKRGEILKLNWGG